MFVIDLGPLCAIIITLLFKQIIEECFMKVDVYFYPHGGSAALNDKNVVVLDVLRATSTIVTALSHGAIEVIPVLEPVEAVDLLRGIGSTDCVTGGERKGYKIEGFDFGNSPLEYTEDSISGKKVILTTTNGTKAIKWVQGAAEVLIGSYLNVSAIADYLREDQRDTVIVCSGREGNFSLEDLACAGKITALLKEAIPSLEMSDAAQTACWISERADQTGLEKFIGETEHGRYLKEIGMASDIKACSALDQHPILPHYRNGKIYIGERQ